MTDAFVREGLKDDALRAEIRKSELESDQLELKLRGHPNRTVVLGPVDDREVELVKAHIEQWTYFSDEGITIEINSPGGGIFSGFGLYDYLRDLVGQGYEIETRAIGYACSMGAILLQAGSHRTMTPNSWIMLHEAATWSTGSTSVQTLRDQAGLLEKLQAQAVDILTERSGCSITEIENRTDRQNWWMRADEALRHGFIDEVREP